MKQAAALSAGANIGVIAPGSPASPDRYNSGCDALSKLGFTAKAPLDPSANYGKYEHGFASDSVQARVSAIHQLAADDDVSVLVAARGAYGSLELLPHLDFDLLRNCGKPVVGYSDVTCLLLPLYGAGGKAVHGPTISKEFAEYYESEDSRKSVDELLKLLSDPKWQIKLNAKVLRNGAAQGKIVAANLTALTALLGTRWEVSLDGCILFLEDIGEAPFRIQRCLEHLRLTGQLNKLAGLVFGRFDRCEAKHGPSVDDVFDWFVTSMVPETTYPVLKDFPFGHNGLNIPLPLGSKAEIDSNQVKLLGLNPA
ncbi:MAG: LD-carboxypeptidase [Bdellovibrionales bacterium]|nr:LD-carboxypeptidase [Bdellovibrionales bacterium]